MQFYQRLPVKYKLLSGFCLTACFCAVVGWVAIKNLESLASADTRLYQSVTVPTEQLGDIAESVQRIRVALRDLLLVSDAKQTSTIVDSIHQLNQQVESTADDSSTIASAVEEQTATANEMIRSVAEASQGTGEISRNISSVAEAARETSVGAERCQKSLGELVHMAQELLALS